MESVIRGRIWKFGHNVDTDVMAPWNTLSLPWEERRKSILHVRPEFVQKVQPGDIIVAGRNWGCGSSREHAPENLKLLGIAAVVAESFGRIYFRNSIAIAFPNLACPGVHDGCEEGDELEITIRTGVVKNFTRNLSFQAQTYAPEMLSILEKGGLLEVLRERLGLPEPGPSA
jgi:3-isopropylmalate/(R)-2-methylmalate dehydratase small subunit